MFSPRTLIGAVIIIVVLGVVLVLMGVLTGGEAARIGGSLIAFDALVTSGVWFARYPHVAPKRAYAESGDPVVAERSQLELLLLGLDDRSNARALSQMLIELSQGGVFRDESLEKRLGEAAIRAGVDISAVRDRHFREGWLVDLEETWKQS